MSYLQLVLARGDEVRYREACVCLAWTSVALVQTFACSLASVQLPLCCHSTTLWVIVIVGSFCAVRADCLLLIGSCSGQRSNTTILTNFMFLLIAVTTFVLLSYSLYSQLQFKHSVCGDNVYMSCDDLPQRISYLSILKIYASVTEAKGHYASKFRSASV